MCVIYNIHYLKALLFNKSDLLLHTTKHQDMHKYILILNLILSFITLSSILTYGQTERKEIIAKRTTTPPKIDGILNDAAWEGVPVANNFVQLEPVNGDPCSFPTEVKFIYDDNALYVAAMFYDPHPDSIMLGLGERDNEDINADVFAVTIGTFDDGHNAFEFWVSASGVQIDKKISANDGDVNWNAVWDSHVNLNDSGWSAEMKIPYSAIRFPKTSEQKWAIIIWRSIKRYNELANWQMIDKEVYGFMNQSGLLLGIKDIEPPLRLSFSPYVSAYVIKNSESDKSSYSYNGGLDLKYGINESFTLDMTLIPDFGQVESDDEVLNLSPFEVKYDEKRTFFTEGTELFNKGGIFYSRRIGATPSNYYSVYGELSDNEIITNNPSETQMINATKISGRTNKGLGIGVFNAMTEEANATISDTLLGESRDFVTQGFTNYNLLVFDQILKNNSYVSVINSNVKRSNYMANVTATEFNLLNKKNSYAIFGTAAMSNKFDAISGNSFGYKYNLKLAKVRGNFRADLHQIVESDTYDPNDLGYLQHNNELTNKLTLEYNFYKPVWKFLSWSNKLELRHTSLYAPRVFSEVEIEVSTHISFRNSTGIRSHASIKPIDNHDYFETRTLTNYVVVPKSFHLCTFYSPNRTKDFTIGGGGAFWVSDYYNQSTFYLQLSPSWRIGDKFHINYWLHHTTKNNTIGYVGASNDTINFGMRDLKEISQTIDFKYIFNNVSSLSFRMRHYWSSAEYSKYMYLQDDGYFETNPTDLKMDVNFNAFNIDMYYSYYFAPGSEVSIAWKYAIYNNKNEAIAKYVDNVRDIINSPYSNSLSIRVLYYIDYVSIKKTLNKK